MAQGATSANPPRRAANSLARRALLPSTSSWSGLRNQRATRAFECAGSHSTCRACRGSRRIRAGLAARPMPARDAASNCWAIDCVNCFAQRCFFALSRLRRQTHEARKRCCCRSDLICIIVQAPPVSTPSSGGMDGGHMRLEPRPDGLATSAWPVQPFGFLHSSDTRIGNKHSRSLATLGTRGSEHTASTSTIPTETRAERDNSPPNQTYRSKHVMPSADTPRIRDKNNTVTRGQCTHARGAHGQPTA